MRLLCTRDSRADPVLLTWISDIFRLLSGRHPLSLDAMLLLLGVQSSLKLSTVCKCFNHHQISIMKQVRLFGCCAAFWLCTEFRRLEHHQTNIEQVTLFGCCAALKLCTVCRCLQCRLVDRWQTLWQTLWQVRSLGCCAAFRLCTLHSWKVCRCLDHYQAYIVEQLRFFGCCGAFHSCVRYVDACITTRRTSWSEQDSLDAALLFTVHSL